MQRQINAITIWKITIRHKRIEIITWIFFQIGEFILFLGMEKIIRSRRIIHAILPLIIPGWFPAKIPWNKVIINSRIPYILWCFKIDFTMGCFCAKAVFLTGASIQTSNNKTEMMDNNLLIKSRFIKPPFNKLISTNY